MANRKATAAARLKMERAQMICSDWVHARGAPIIYDRECGALVSTAGLNHVPEMPEMRSLIMLAAMAWGAYLLIQQHRNFERD